MTNHSEKLIKDMQKFLVGEADSVNLPETLNELRYEMITRAVIASNGNNTKAAKMLGIKRTALLHHTSGKYKHEQNSRS